MKKNWVTWIVILLISLASFVRLYKFSVMQFDSDFGRDSLFAMRILEGKLTLIGAKTSVGGFYLGPLYFYGIALIFAIVGYIPEAVSFAFALMNIVGLWLGYKILARRFSSEAGILFLFFGTALPLLVLASRGATCWPMILITTVGWIELLWRSMERKHWLWKIAAGLAFGLFLHIHFSALIALPAYLVVVFWNGGKHWKTRLIGLFFHLLGIGIMISPLILFDLRHQFVMTKSVAVFVEELAGKEGSQRKDLPKWSFEKRIDAIGEFIAPNRLLQLVAVGLVGFASYTLFQKKKLLNQNQKRNVYSLSVITISSLLIFLVYPGYLFEYYLVVPCVLVLLLVSILLSCVPWKNIGLVFGVACLWLNLQQLSPLYREQFRVISNLERITHLIEQDIDKNPKRTFTIFKDGGDGMSGLAYEYRFLLARDGYKPVDENFYERAEALYVIREHGANDPLTLGNHEVRQFNPKLIESETTFELDGKKITVFEMVK